MTERIHAVADDPEQVRKVGTMIATELSEQLLAGGAPGLHFFTQNRSQRPERSTPTCTRSGVERDQPLGRPGQGDVEGTDTTGRGGHDLVGLDHQHRVVLQAFDPVGLTTRTRSEGRAPAAVSASVSVASRGCGTITPTVPSTSANSRAPRRPPSRYAVRAGDRKSGRTPVDRTAWGRSACG